MVLVKINYASVSPIIKITYDETPVYIKTSVNNVYAKVVYGTSIKWGDIEGTLSDQTDLQNALDDKVPYTGATANVDLGEYELKAGQLTLDVSPTGTASVGTTRWNNTIGSSETTLKGGSVVLKNGVDLVARIVNKVTPNTTLTKAAYQAVRISGAQGQRLAVAFAQANNDNNSADTIGLVTETIATNQEGFIMTVGSLEGINTTGSLQGETWSDGDVLYLSPTVAGAITNVKPVAPQHLVVIGYVEYAHQNNGKIYVKIMNGWELGELHDVNTNGATNGQVLTYNGSIWVPSTNGVGTVTSVDMTVPTGLTVSGNPITSSGTLALGLASGYSIPTDANQTNWTAAYNDKINSAAVTGTTTKTLTLNQQDGGTITASWNDYDTAPVTSVFGRTGAVVATSGDYTTDQVTEGTNLYFTDARARAAISLTTTGTSGAATYVGGVLNIPQYQAALTNPITGTGTAGQVAYWSGTNTQTGSNNFYIDAATSKLGIGTSSPTSNAANSGLIHINGSASNSEIHLTNSSTGTSGTDGSILLQYATQTLLFNLENNILGFGTNNTERARFTAGGNLLVGTTTDSGYKLDVNGTIRGTSSITGAQFYASNTNGLSLIDNAVGGFLSYGYNSGRTNAAGHYFYNGITTELMRITSGGNLLVGTTTDSGEKLQVNGRVKSSDFASNNGTVETRLSWSSTPAGVVGTISNHPLEFYTNSSPKMTLSASGNLGLGVTPSAWRNIFNAFQIGYTGTLYSLTVSNATEQVNLASNYYQNSAGAELRVQVGFATRYQQGSGEHRWSTAASSTAGSAITFTQAMTLNASGNLGIGTTSTTKSRASILSSGGALPVLGQDVPTSNLFLTQNNTWGMYIGLEAATGKGYIQQMRNDSATSYPLILQPVGGNLLVGTTTDGGQRLQVSGTMSVTGAATFSSSVTANLGMIVNGYTLASSGLNLEFGIISGYTQFNSYNRTTSSFAGVRIDGSYVSINSGSGGNLGIGTASPAYRLQVDGASTAGFVTPLLIKNPSTNAASSVKMAFDGGGTIWGEIGSSYNTNNPYMAFFVRANSEKMRITDGGNVAIGTLLPTSYGSYTTLCINNAGNGAVIDLLQNDIRTGSIYTSVSGAGLNINTVTSNPLIFLTANTERARFTSGGNLLVGTTTDSGQKLQVSGDARASRFISSTSSSYTNDFLNLNIGTVSQSIGLRFGYDGVTYNKGALYFISKSSNGVGDLVFALNNAENSQNVSISNERMRLDSNGNLGLGVTPSAWSASYKALQIGNSLAFLGASAAADIYFNAFFDGTNFKYISSTSASLYSLSGGQHRFYNAPVGTAGNNITFTQAMTLNASGNLGIANTSPTYILDVISRASGEGGVRFWNNRANTSTVDSIALNLHVSNSIGQTGGKIVVAENTNDSWPTNMQFYVNSASSSYNPTEAMRITSGGNLLVGTTTDGGYKLDVNGTARVQGDFTLSDTRNIIVGTTTGTKIGTATSQKIGFWNATPIVQPTTAIAEAAFVENSGGTAVNVDSTFAGYTLQQIAQALKDMGILA